MKYDFLKTILNHYKLNEIYAKSNFSFMHSISCRSGCKQLHFYNDYWEENYVHIKLTAIINFTWHHVITLSFYKIQMSSFHIGSFPFQGSYDKKKFIKLSSWEY